jgi:hypothetical protein
MQISNFHDNVLSSSENLSIAMFKLTNCKFSTIQNKEANKGCNCKQKVLKRFCSKKQIELNSSKECFNCDLFEKKS